MQIIHGVIERIYKRKFPTQFMRQFITLCQQKETNKAINLLMNEHERRAKEYVEILSC